MFSVRNAPSVVVMRQFKKDWVQRTTGANPAQHWALLNAMYCVATPGEPITNAPIVCFNAPAVGSCRRARSKDSRS